MNYGFFCDTGPIRGVCDLKDFHREASKFFFERYPVDEYDYYIPETVLKELNGYKFRLRKKAKELEIDKQYFKYIRLVQQCMDYYLEKMIVFSCEEDEQDPKLGTVILSIQPIIGYKEINQRNDVDIVSNAIVWSILTNYNEKILITLDRNHLYAKRKKIIREVQKNVNEHIDISICYVPFYYGSKRQLTQDK